MDFKKVAIPTLILVSFFWGATFTVVKSVLDLIDAYTYLAVRFFVGAIALLPFMSKRFSKINGKIIIQGMILGTVLFSAYAFQTVGLNFTTASNSGFLTGLNVILVPLIVAMLIKKFPKFYSLLGAVFAVFGIGLLSLKDGLTLNFGDFLTMMCALMFALHFIFTDRYTKLSDTFLLTFIQLLTVSILSFGGTFFTKSSFTVNFESVFTILFTGLFCTTFSFLAVTYMQKFISPSKTAIIVSLEPVFAAIAAYFLGNERFTFAQISGSLLIFLGILTSTFGSRLYLKMKKSFRKLP